MRLAAILLLAALASGASAFGCDVATQGLRLHREANKASGPVYYFNEEDSLKTAFDGNMFTFSVPLNKAPKEPELAAWIEAQLSPRMSAFYNAPESTLAIALKAGTTAMREFSGNFDAANSHFLVAGLARRATRGKRFVVAANVVTQELAEQAQARLLDYINHPGHECTAGDSP